MKATEDDAVDDIDNIPGNLSWINEIEDVSVEDGIKNSGGVSSFINALNMFADTLDTGSKVIEDAYNDDDIKLFTVKAHALKTSARIIGANALSGLAEHLEDAGNKNDTEYIRENAGRLISGYRAFKDKLKRLKEDNTDDGREMISEDELKDAYSALREVIPQMDYDSVEMIIGQLNEYKLPEEDRERIDKLNGMLKLFAWDEMEELIGNE